MRLIVLLIWSWALQANCVTFNHTSYGIKAGITTRGNVTSLQCIENFTLAVNGLYTNISRNPGSVERLVRDNLVPCLEVARSSDGLDVRVMSTSIVHFPEGFFNNLAAKFNNLSSLPYNIAFDFLPVNSWTSLVEEILLEYRRNLTTTAHTGFLYGGLQLSSLAYGGVMADLSSMVLDEGAELGWLDILPFVRQQMATYSGKLVGIPLDGRANMIFYRWDILEKLNVTEPATYDDLLKFAAMVNGTRLGPNGEPIWGLCLPYIGRDRSCMLTHNFFWDVLAPYTQARGSSQGFAVDPNNLDILFDSEAGVAALTMIRDLVKYSLMNGTCADLTENFITGRCAVTFGRAAQFKINQLSPKSIVKDLTVARPCPGSTHILNRATRKLEPCNPGNCPNAKVARLLNGSVALVNTAPFSSASGYAAAVSAVAPNSQRLATFRYLSYVALSDELREVILDHNTWWGPCRASHFNLSVWLAKGYPKNSTLQFLTTTRQLLGGHNNIALPPNFVQFTTFLVPHIGSQIISLVNNRVSPQVALQNIVGNMNSLIRQLGTSVALKQLRGALNWLPTPPTTPSSPPQQRNGTAPWTYLTAIALVGSFLLVGLSILAFVYYKGRLHSRGLFGNVRPPNEGQGSTLVVTDVQDSTLLWESLPMDVMDVVIKVHHSCLRSLLPTYRGYESTTEGDSLILAFHDAPSALTFALEAQNALLQAPWPMELLEHPLCQATMLRLGDRDPLDMQLEWDSSGGSQDDGSSSATAGGLGSCMMAERLAKPRLKLDMEGADGVKFADVCRQAWEPVETRESSPVSRAEPVLAFRGARVRMGLHSGVGPGETKMNLVDDRRTHYVGACLSTAKLVADCGAGGTVSISGDTYNLLPMEKMWKNMKLWHAGMHFLQVDMLPMHIYQVLPTQLSCRVSCLRPPLSLRQLSPGAMEAPAGCVAISFMKVAGLDTLKHWNLGVTNAALTLWQQLVLQQLQQHEGYVVEAKEDMMLVAFAKVRHSLVWATQCSRVLLEADWSDELLGHEMGEQVSVLLEADRQGEWRSEVMMRGLRVKVGMDWGPVLCSLQPMTGKMGYNGRVMNRAARIASKATPGQVLTTSYTWAAAGRVPSLFAAPIGPVKLKGISEDLYLVQVKMSRSSEVTSAASLAVVAPSDDAPAGYTRDTIPSGPLVLHLDNATQAMPSSSLSDDIVDQYTGEF